jgi:hypothetical protein|tara:strand:- start:1245 stop:1595 length:351 start_codon:yes stop_codon:yes gene_type:complete
MGRYYTGDIEGKFMFAVQGSDAGERFGAVESNVISYSVSRGCYDDIVKELKSIEDSGCLERAEARMREGYDMKSPFVQTPERKDLEEYADYRMGKKIKQWFDDNPDDDYLYFDAEC